MLMCRWATNKQTNRMYIGVLWCDSGGWTNQAKDIRGKCLLWGYIFLKTLTLSTWAQPVPLTPPCSCWTRRWGWGTRLMNLIRNYDFPSPLFFNSSIKRNECTKKDKLQNLFMSRKMIWMGRFPTSWWWNHWFHTYQTVYICDSKNPSVCCGKCKIS